MKAILVLPVVTIIFLICTKAKGQERYSKETGEIKEFDIESKYGKRKLKLQIIDDKVILDGDIILGAANRIGKLKLIRIEDEKTRWPYNTIPYVIQQNHPAKQDIIWAVNHINEKTNLKLVPRSNQADYVTFTTLGGCASPLGRQGSNQNIEINQYCGRGSVVHEILHSAGLYHEQSRDDRNTFIHINPQNIGTGNEYNFQQENNLGTNMADYDYGSIMHYPKDAFSGNGQNTIDVLSPPAPSGTFIGQRDGLSKGDINSVNNIYPEFWLRTEIPSFFPVNILTTFQLAHWDGDKIIDLFIVRKDISTSSYKTEVRILSGASNFQKLIFDDVAALPQTSERDIEYKFADWDGDHIVDMIGVSASKTGAGKVELYILSGAKKFKEFIKIPTAMELNGRNMEFEFADFDEDNILDLISIWKSPTDSRRTEVHILSGASNFKQFLLRKATALENSNDNIHFQTIYWDNDRIPDLMYFKLNQTNSKRTEIHILSGKTQYREHIFNTETGFDEKDHLKWLFHFDDWNGDNIKDLIGIFKYGTPSKKTEIHILKQVFE